MERHITLATHCRDTTLDHVMTPVTGSVLTDVLVEFLLIDHHNVLCKVIVNKPRLGCNKIF